LEQLDVKFEETEGICASHAFFEESFEVIYPKEALLLLVFITELLDFRELLVHSLNEFLNSVEDLVDLQGVVDAVPEQ
jgi:hypothetical protein